MKDDFNLKRLKTDLIFLVGMCSMIFIIMVSFTVTFWLCAYILDFLP